MLLADAHGWLPWEVDRIEDDYEGLLTELFALWDARAKPQKPTKLATERDDEDD